MNDTFTIFGGTVQNVSIQGSTTYLELPIALKSSKEKALSSSGLKKCLEPFISFSVSLSLALEKSLLRNRLQTQFIG